jgi:hypothetical protein
MLIAILGLLCVILVDGTGDERRLESESMVEREEMLTEADRLLQAMERGNTVLSVHYALSAGKAAANCGLREESAMFSAIGDALMGGGKLEEAAETVRAFLRDGSLPVKESETSSEKTEPPVDKTVSVMREARAKESADRFFGLSGTWRGGEGTNTLIYSCTNGYAVMDARNGMPVEGAISLPPVGDIRYSAEECVVRGMQFLRQFYSTGTVDSLAEASEFIRVIETRQGVQISALEEIACHNGWITKEKLQKAAAMFGKSPYGAHLRNVADGKYIY